MRARLRGLSLGEADRASSSPPARRPAAEASDGGHGAEPASKMQPGRELTRLVMRFGSGQSDSVSTLDQAAIRRLRRLGRLHIRSTTSIPSRPSPNFKVLAVRSQRASRLSRRSADSAFRTGHSSKNVLNALARSNR